MATKYVADPILNTIAHRTESALWVHQLDEGELELCAAKAEDRELPRHMVSMLRDYKTWVVRAYLAGTQRTFGFFRTGGPSIQGVPWQALRYADMIRMYFWKYKRRDAVEPNDFMLNISPQRAKSDLMCETNMVQIIKDIEQHLKDTGAILSPEEMERQTQAKIRQQRARPTAQSVIQDLGGVFQMRCDKLEEMAKEHGKDISELKALIKLQSDSLARVSSFVESLLTVARQNNQRLPIGTRETLPLGTGDPLPPIGTTFCGGAS